MNNAERKNLKIEIKSLSKDYLIPDSNEILNVFNDLSFEVYEGDIISIIGPSGCGKSTLLRIMAGLIPPSSGTILVDNVEVKNPSPDRILVFQDLHLFNWMTVYKNIEFVYLAQKKKRSEVSCKIHDIITLVGLNGFEKYYPHEISGGMRQRLALARALAAEPSLLLLDEPFSSLDAGIKMELEKEFLNLIKSKKITTILVTHDVRQSIYVGDKVIVLSKRPGRIKEVFDIKFPSPRENTLWETEEFHQLEILLSKNLKEST